MNDVVFDAIVARVKEFFDAFARERIAGGNFVPVEAVARFVFPEAEVFDPRTAEGNSDVADIVNVVVRDYVFAALGDKNGG